jgi:hypothetical protein
MWQSNYKNIAKEEDCKRKKESTEDKVNMELECS